MSRLYTRVKYFLNIEYILLTYILLLCLLVRLYKINNPVADWHSFRQVDTASVTREFIKDGLNLFVPTYHDISTTQSGLFNPEGYRFVEFPLYNLLQAVLLKAFPPFSLEVWGRFLSIFSAIVSTYFIYLLGKRYKNVKVGLLAGFFYAILPFNIFFTRVILPEPMAISLALASLWLFTGYIDNEKIKHLYWSATLFSLAVLIKPYLIFYATPMLFLAIQKDGLKGVVKKKEYYLAGLIIIIPFLVWRLWMQRFPEGIPFWQWVFNGDNIRFKPSFWRWLFGERLTKLILGYWGLVPFVFGILSERKKIFNNSFLLGMFLYVSIIATANVRHDYYQLLVIPAVCLSLASGSLFLWENHFFNKGLSKGVLLFSIFMMIATGAYQVREDYKINHPEIIEAGQAVDALTPQDALVIAAYNGDTAFLYQTKRKGWPVVDRPIDELIEKGAAYYVSVNLEHNQTIEFSKRFRTIQRTDKYIILDLKQKLPL